MIGIRSSRDFSSNSIVFSNNRRLANISLTSGQNFPVRDLLDILESPERSVGNFDDVTSGFRA